MANQPAALAGIYEFVHGHLAADREAVLAFWAHFGFAPIEEGSCDADAAAALYGHRSAVTSVRLAHPGCETYGTGHVRLQFWETLRNDGLGDAKGLDVGSRWMGIYTRAGQRVMEAMHGEADAKNWSLTGLVRAAFAWPEPPITLASPFLGLREFLAFAPEFRLAFVERVGFERPGFGTFAEDLPFRNTEGSHANIVQPMGAFSSDFYKEVFGLVTMAGGEAHDSGGEAPTIEALKLAPGQMFHIERLVHPDCPAGMLQVYSPHSDAADVRDRARPGSLGIGCYTYQVRDLAAFREAITAAGASDVTPRCTDEFGTDAISFLAPDGIFWTVTQG